MINKTTIEICKGIPFGISIVTFISGIVNKAYPFGVTVSSVLVVSLTLVYLSVTYFGEKYLRSLYILARNSPKEKQFFKRWYSQDGKLFIFCDDLEWLRRDQEILGVLSIKANNNNLYLYLKNFEADFTSVDFLFRAGAYIYDVQQHLKSNHRFSLLDDGGIKRIILRNKLVEKSDNNIEFVEYKENQAICHLAEDLLDDCYNEEFHRSKTSSLPRGIGRLQTV